MNVIVLAGILAFLGQVEENPLKTRQLVVYPTGPAWVHWTGTASPEEVRFVLPAGTVPDECSVKVPGSADQAVDWAWSDARGHWENIVAEIDHSEGPAIGLLQAKENHYLLKNGNHAWYFPINKVQQVRVFDRFRAKWLSPPPKEQVSFDVLGPAHGLNWEPAYRIDLGAEGTGKFTLQARIRNWGPERWTADSVLLSIVNPNTSTGDAALDSSQYDWGALEIDPVMAVGKQLVAAAVELKETVVWDVGGPDLAGIAIGKLDRLRTEYSFTPPKESPSLAPGKVTVFRGGLPVGHDMLPRVLPGNNVNVTVGGPIDIAIQREETELERKQSAVQRENEYYDWIQMAGTLTIHNRRTVPVRMRVVKDFEGEGTQVSDEGAVIRKANAIGRREVQSEIRWNLTIPAGQEKRLTYGYVVHLASVKD